MRNSGSLAALAIVTTVLSTTGSSDPPNLQQLECSLHKLAYEFGVSKVSSHTHFKFGV